MASALLTKSENNYSAAKVLIEKGFPNSSVHCSYYSCVQLMIHILVDKYGETHDTLRSHGENWKKGSHETAIKLLCGHLRSMHVSFRDFNNEINELKMLRTDVDYKEREIDAAGGRDIRGKANTVREFLKEKFQL